MSVADDTTVMKMAMVVQAVFACWRAPETGFRPRIGVRGKLFAGMTVWVVALVVKDGFETRPSTGGLPMVIL